MAFKGWSAQAIEFFEDLEEDNSKTYWHAHKTVYEEAVRRPMEQLLADLEPQFGAGKIFRPYRDVRFSADKSPYKTTIAATLEAGGYVQFSAGGLGAGSGRYVMATDELERFRGAVADDRTGAQLADLVAALRQDGVDVVSHGELKIAPRGYPKDHARVDLLRLKGLVSWKDWPVETALTPGAKELLVAFLCASAPINAWLDDHVGPPKR
jgi:uncharacterized protein (TIGR02453 family)